MNDKTADILHDIDEHLRVVDALRGELPLKLRGQASTAPLTELASVFEAHPAHRLLARPSGGVLLPTVRVLPVLEQVGA